MLRYLVENAGRVIPKEELIKAVWPDVTVTDESLTVCVSEIRRALGEESHQVIKTVPKRGYLFDVPTIARDLGVAHLRTPIAIDPSAPALPPADRSSALH